MRAALILAMLLASEEVPRPGVTRRLLTTEDLRAIGQRIERDGDFPDEDRRFLEQLEREQPPTIHLRDRLRLDELLRGQEPRERQER